jgi:hypothetical protein
MAWLSLAFTLKLLENLVLQGSLDLSPWLFVLPSELSPFRQLLKQVGSCVISCSAG